MQYYVRVLKDEKVGLKGFLEDLKLHGEVKAHLMPEIEVVREDYFNDMVNDREDEELEEGYVQSFTKMTLAEIEERATN